MSFPHHTYQQAPKEGSYRLIESENAAPVQDPGPQDVPEEIFRCYHRAHVKRIVLIHGTFAGNDALGLIREVSRISPATGRAIKTRTARFVEQLLGEVGNYTSSFATCLSQLLNQGSAPTIEVSIFRWSGENHHLGRAEAAIALLDQMSRTKWRPGERLLVWGHSHAGNVLALLTNLLGANAQAREDFFRATRLHYRSPLLRRTDLPTWERARSYLADQAPGRPDLDVVTFGTPLRYRWNTRVCPRLLHFVNHRPLVEGSPWRAALPGGVEEVLQARSGDYVQQLGIAGTNFLHYLGAWRSWRAEQKLHRLLQRGVRKRDLIHNLRNGLRVSQDGKTLLVDYAVTDKRWAVKAAGHAVYTRPEWLPFHLREIARCLYGAEAEFKQ